MSFLKYLNRTGQGHEKLYWGRADLDGAPYRGPAPPMLKEDEFESLAQRVYDAQVDTFDMSDSDARAQLREILDCSANQWYRILFIDRKFVESRGTWLVYVEWAEPHMEIARSKLRTLQG